MMKRTKYLEIPWYIYLALILASISKIICSYILPLDCWIRDILSNIGYALLTSSVFALLTDIVKTSQEQKRQAEIYFRLSEKLKSKCTNLPSEIHTNVLQFRKGEQHIYSAKYTFEDWVRLLFEKNSVESEHVKKQEFEIIASMQEVSEISSYAKSLSDISKIFIQNPHFDRAFTEELNQLRSICERIYREYKNFGIEYCEKAFAKELPDAIIKLYPDLENSYKKTYNDEDYMS